MTPPTAVYRIFRRGEGEAASMRPVIAALVVLAVALTALGVFRVNRQHAVLRLGYELSRKSQHVRHLREVRRQLALERATLTAPDRIRRLATELGMTQIAPDRIRVIHAATAPARKVAAR